MAVDSTYDQKSLLLLIAEGDEHAFRQLFIRYERKIYTIAYHITKSETSSEELLQDVFLSIWLKREQLAQIEDFESYLFIVARNAAYKAIKKTMRERRVKQAGWELLVYHPEKDEPVALHEYKDLLQKAISKLPPQQKQAYRLVKEEGLSNEQAARVMNIEIGTIKVHLKKAVKAVRAFCLADLKLILIALALLKKM